MTDQTTRLTLGGVPLGTFNFSWSLTSGVVPETRIVEVSDARAAQIMALGLGPHELVLSKPGAESRPIKGIYVLGEQPGDSPHTKGLLLADARWLWPRRLVSRSYNVRRRTGKRRAIGSRPESADLVDDVAYTPWSLKAGAVAWSAQEILQDVLAEVHQALVGADIVAPGAIVPTIERDVPVESLELDDTGEVAVLRVLQYLPGYDVYLDYDGKAVVYDTRDKEITGGTRTRENPTGLGKAHVGTGHALKVDKARLRPVWVDVYFVPEVEVRFDYAEDSQFTTQALNREEPKLENVAPNPEWELVIDGATAAQGEWHKIGDAATTANSSTGGLLQAFEDNSPANATARSGLGVSLAQVAPLSLSIIRKYYFPGLRSLLASYATLAQGTVEAVWAARVQTILQHYRTTFRMLPRWLDKVRSWRPYRVGIMDSETGGRAPSQVWTDYTVVPSVKGIVHRTTQDESMGWLVTGYNADLASGKAGPFRVDTVDHDQGIMRIEPRADPWGFAQSVIPGHPDKTPSMDLRRSNQAELADTISATWGGAGLASSWQLSTVLSVVPAAPNSLKRLYKRTVYSGEMNVGPAQGPPASVFIGPGVLTAMFGWDDAQATSIKEVFFGDHTTGPGSDRWENVDALLVNEDHVAGVAKAAAARLYELYTDRWEGSYRGPLNMDAVPRGSMRTVTHQLQFAGAGQTVAGTLFQMPPIRQPMDLVPFLPDTISKVVLRTAQP